MFWLSRNLNFFLLELLQIDIEHQLQSYETFVRKNWLKAMGFLLSNVLQRFLY